MTHQILAFTITSKTLERPLSLKTAEKLLENKEISKFNFKYDALASLMMIKLLLRKTKVSQETIKTLSSTIWLLH